jgi:hypothetical protein
MIQFGQCQKGGSLIHLGNVGDLTKPATTLIEKISDAIGGLYRPRQIRRVAQAEADAEIVKAEAHIKITELERRAVNRFFAEEAKKQANIEAIILKSLPDVRDNARPEQMEDDWVANFFDKCRLISDEEMQSLWSKLLAGEANNPGQYSKRTVEFLASMDKSDAELFQKLCSFVWTIDDRPVPLIYNYNDGIYEGHGIIFENLNHLDDIGLISQGSGFGQILAESRANLRASYGGNAFDVEPPPHRHPKEFGAGSVLFTKTGEQLYRICDSATMPAFVDYVKRWWSSLGYKVTPVISDT